MLHLHWSQIAAVCWLCIKGLLENPLLYIGLVLMIWDVRRVSGLERQFFGFRVSHPWRRLIRLWLGSCIFGLIVSLVGVVFGITVEPWQVWTVTAICIVGGVIRLRFAAGLYGIAWLLVIGILATRFTPTGLHGMTGDWLAAMRAVRPADWLSLGCLLAFAEAYLLFLDRHNQSPVLKRSKRGRPIGAFALQSTFLMPVFVIVPGAVSMHLHVPWPWPLWGPIASGIGALGFPVLAGYSGIHAVAEGQVVIRRQVVALVMIGILLGADAWISQYFGALYALVGFAAILAVREWNLGRVKRLEINGDPKFVPSPNGVKVLAVAPESVAASMGLRPGEVIRQVNQVPVHTTYDLHFALDQNPAYAKLEVLDVRGELRLVGKPVYSGERHKLGLVLVPDRSTVRSFDRNAFGVLQTLYPRVCEPAVGPEETWLNTDSSTLTT
jgi:hypothetical protein